MGNNEMQCPYCDFQHARVIDSRLSEGKDAVRRRRECPSCGKRFTTYERWEQLRLMVRKRDGSREPFERAKLRDGLAKACAKRPISEEEIEYMVDEIEAALGKRPRRREVSSRRIGDMALVQLRRLDMVSYLRFASVFRQYTDAEQFHRELVRLAEAAPVEGVQRLSLRGQGLWLRG